MAAVLFVVVFVIVVVGSVATALSREHRRVRAAVPGYRGDHLTPYELAYLSGGPRRVVNTALGLLARTGAIRVSRGGQASLVAGTRGSPDPIEHAVLDGLRTRGGRSPVGELRRTVADGQAVDGLRHRLLGLGLIVPDGALAHAGKLLNRLLAVSVLGLVIEVIIVASGIALGFFGVIALLIGALAAIGGLVVYSWQKRALRGVLSRAGHEVLGAARRTHVRGARATTPDLAFAVGVPVALYGLGELGEPGLEKELRRDSGSGSGSGCATGSCGGGSSSSGDGSTFGSGGWGGGDSGGGSSDGGGGDGGGGSSCGGGGCGGS